jgi:hypothetical protein
MGIIVYLTAFEGTSLVSERYFVSVLTHCLAEVGEPTGMVWMLTCMQLVINVLQHTKRNPGHTVLLCPQKICVSVWIVKPNGRSCFTWWVCCYEACVSSSLYSISRHACFDITYSFLGLGLCYRICPVGLSCSVYTYLYIFMLIILWRVTLCPLLRQPLQLERTFPQQWICGNCGAPAATNRGKELSLSNNGWDKTRYRCNL